VNLPEPTDGRFPGSQNPTDGRVYSRSAAAWAGRRGSSGRLGEASLPLEAGAEGGERDVGEGGDAEIGMSEIVMRGRGAGGGDAPEVGTFGGETAGVRVFEGDGFVATEAEVFEDQFVEVGLRFRCAHVFAAGDEGKAVEQAESSEVGFDPRVFGVGSYCDGQGGGASLVEQGDDTRERGEKFEAALFGVLAFGLESDAVVVSSEVGPRIKGEIGMPDGPEETRMVEGHAVGVVNIGVGADEGGLGVEDKAVEIENESADHGERSEGRGRGGRVGDAALLYE